MYSYLASHELHSKQDRRRLVYAMLVILLRDTISSKMFRLSVSSSKVTRSKVTRRESTGEYFLLWVTGGEASH